MCLLASPDRRIGSRSNGSMDFENGLIQVIAHPWFTNFDWEGLHHCEGPFLPKGAHEFPHVLKALAYVFFLSNVMKRCYRIFLVNCVFHALCMQFLSKDGPKFQSSGLDGDSKF